MAGLSITRAWNETKAVIAAERRLLLPLVIMLIALPATLLGLVAPRQSLLQPTQGGALESLISIAVLLVSVAASLAVTRIALGYHGSLGQAIGEGFKRMWTLLGAAILVGAMLVVPVMLLLFAMAAAGLIVMPDDPTQQMPMNGALALLVIALAVGIIIVGVRLLMMNPAVMAERQNSWSLIKRSFALTKGHFWRLLATMLVLLVGFLVAAVAIGAVVGGFAVSVLGPLDPMSLSALLVSLVGGILQAIYSVVAATMIARIYLQLADRPAA